MTEPPAPERIAVIWSLGGSRRSPRHRPRNCDADSPLRRPLSRQPLRRRKKLKPPRTGFRLRCGDYRVFFDLKDENTITITGVRHRPEAYR